MKAKLFLGIIMGAITLGTMTSCLGDDDNDNNYVYTDYTHAEKQQQLATMAGNYTGAQYSVPIYNGYTVNFRDSTGGASWTAADSTLTIHNLYLKPTLTANSYFSRDSLDDDASIKDIKMRILPYLPYGYTKEQMNGNIYFTLIPQSKTIDFSINYNGKPHKAQLELQTDYVQTGVNSIYNEGRYLKKQTIVYVLLKGITIEGLTKNQRSLNTYVMFFGNKE